MTVAAATFVDGNLYCRFTRQTVIQVSGQTFDMADPKGLFLLLARGAAKDQAIEYHAGQKAVSARSVQLAETGAVAANKGAVIT